MHINIVLFSTMVLLIIVLSFAVYFLWKGKKITIPGNYNSPETRKVNTSWRANLMAFEADSEEMQRKRDMSLIKFKDDLYLTLQEYKEISAERIHQLFLVPQKENEEVRLLMMKSLGIALVEYILISEKNLYNVAQIYKNSVSLGYDYIFNLISEIMATNKSIASIDASEGILYPVLFKKLIVKM